LSSSLAKDPMKGERLKGNWKGLWRLREGDYRIIYAVVNDELVILILRIGHRRDVYK